MEQELIDINWESDLDFILTLLDERDVNLGVPDWDWEAELYTTSVGRRVVISQIGGVRTGWHEDDGVIHVTVDGGRLLPGELRVKFTAHLPNDHHPDSVESVVHVAPLNVRLIRGNAPCPSTFTSSVILPAIKGDPFRYEDFTPEQLEDLRRPATEAAEALNTAETQREQAESERVKAETLRDARESTREKNEAKRIANETARQTQEVEREAAEIVRNAQETQRIADEVKRQSAENIRENKDAERNKVIQSLQTRIAELESQLADIHSHTYLIAE